MAHTEKFEKVSIDKLVPYARNARTHSKQQIAELRASLREFGFVSPVLVDENYTILAGHGRVMAAKEEGITEVPCVFANSLTDAQKKAYILADNRLALNAGWDEEMLAVEIADLKGTDFDVNLLGFSEDELAKILNADAEGEEDDFDVDAELEKPCFSKTGDVWKIGKHKVICGDSTKQETYAALLGETKANLVCTDPPYLVAYENKSGKIKNDDLNDADGYKFLKSVFENFHAAMSNDASIYVFYAAVKARVFYDAFEDAGFRVSTGLVWKKDRFTISRTDWKHLHEPIIYGWKKDGRHRWYGDQKQPTVFEFARIKDSAKEGCGHPTSKPVPLIAYLIKQCTMENGVVLDGFLGSASALVACEQLGRICYGVELEPKFVDVAVKRYIALKNGDSSDVFLIRDGEEIPFGKVEGVADGSQ